MCCEVCDVQSQGEMGGRGWEFFSTKHQSSSAVKRGSGTPNFLTTRLLIIWVFSFFKVLQQIYFDLLHPPGVEKCARATADSEDLA